MKTVRHFNFSGTPEQVASMIQPFIGAGADHGMLGDYGSLVTAGDMGSAVEGSRQPAVCDRPLRGASSQNLNFTHMTGSTIRCHAGVIALSLAGN
jgi:hypothetical protein